MSSQQRRYDVVKRGIDIIGAGVGLVLLSPVMGATAALVRCKLGSPVLFAQERPGMDGKIFRLYKFRSMLEVDEANALISDEDRLTRFGKLLRSTSLDELPSLVNVLKGEMSLVGPRPLLVEYLDLYSPEQARRHEVRPGITGAAQVNGRNAITWEQKFAYDVAYVENRSLSVDLSIVVKTIKAIFLREGINQHGHVSMRKFGDVND